MDKYKVVKKVGTGTYGSAYLVSVQSSPGLQLVLKKIKIDEDCAKEKQQAGGETRSSGRTLHVPHAFWPRHLTMCLVPHAAPSACSQSVAAMHHTVRITRQPGTPDP